MKTRKHTSEDNRKTICSCISHNKKLIEISKIINYKSIFIFLDTFCIQFKTKVEIHVLPLFYKGI